MPVQNPAAGNVIGITKSCDAWHRIFIPNLLGCTGSHHRAPGTSPGRVSPPGRSSRNEASMSKDEGGVLDFLKSQLSFIESGGYTDLERSKSGRALIFRDSPGCLLSGNAQRSSSCYDCPLMEFVPPADRSRNLPCHGVPVGLNGETVREAAAD